MAFLIAFTDERTGAVFPAAYARLDLAALNYADGSLKVQVGIYASEAAAKAGKTPIKVQDVVLPSNAELAARETARALIYGQLKLLDPVYGSAVEV